jgi:predicted RNase H-like HicB family nuclease
MAVRISFRGEIYQEARLYVAICPELDVSSFGETPREAEDSLREAVSAFLDECEALGSLTEVLEEAGFAKRGDAWVSRTPVLAKSLTTE